MPRVSAANYSSREHVTHRVPRSIEVRESEGERAEISSQGYGFLTDLFRRHDLDQDGVLNARELSELFAVCPEHAHPWTQFHFPHCTATDKHGHLTLQGFLGMWR